MSLQAISLIFAAILLAPLLVPAPALALMPPHLTGSEPASGEQFFGRTIILHGFSLEYADLENLQVLDTANGSAVEFTTKLACCWEGTGDCAGCKQQRCDLTITLETTVPGHSYQVLFLDESYTFVAAD